MISFLFRFLFLLTLSNALLAQTTEDVRREIDKIIKYDTEITFDMTPGFIVGIIDEDSTYILPFGTLSRNDDEPLSKESIFQLGSLTKVFTASLVGHLVSKGVFHYDDRLSQFFPDCTSKALDSLSIGDLLSHATAFSKTPSNLGELQDDVRNPYGQYDDAKLLEYLCTHQRKSTRKFNYSHVNYALLTIIISQKLGMPFREVMNDYVQEQLALSQTKTTSTVPRNDLCLGHDRVGLETSPWTFNTFEGSEGMTSNLDDLIKFCRRHIETDQFKGDYTKQVQTHYHDQIYVGRAWHIFDYRKYPFYSHSGKAGGHYAFMSFVRATKTGVVILANGTEGTEDLGLLILRMINKNWKRKSHKG